MVHIAGRVGKLAQIGGNPQAGCQHQHSPLNVPPVLNAQPEGALDRAAAAVQIFHRDDKAEQHHRQIDGLGRANQPTQRDQKQLFPPDGLLAAQPQAERRVAENCSQYRGIR